MKVAKPKPYWEMTKEELQEATKEFDKEFVATKPLSAANRRRLAQARRVAKAGRPKEGEGARRVLVSIEKSLLRDADRLAKSRKTSRSRLIAEGLRVILAKRRKAG